MFIEEIALKKLKKTCFMVYVILTNCYKPNLNFPAISTVYIFKPILN